MRSPSRTSALTFAVIALLACGDDTPTNAPPSASNLDGQWTRLDQVPGSSERWDLAVTDTVVAGAGTWTGEACCAGTLTLRGFVSKDSLHADVTLVVTTGAPRSIHEHFDGALQSASLLAGMGSSEGSPPHPERLQRGPITP